jgi:hypothetical protein
VNDLNAIVVFPAKEWTEFLSYTFVPRGTTQHYITGMKTATKYQLTADASTRAITTDDSGVLGFTTGSFDPSVSIFENTVDAPWVTTTALTPGTMGSLYTQRLASSGGAQPVIWSIVGNNLPPGLSLSPTDGAITGVPEGIGTWRPIVKVTDAFGIATTQTVSLTISGQSERPPASPRAPR